MDTGVNERRRRMQFGAALHVGSHTIAVAYCLLTLGEPNRGPMLVAYGCGVATGLVGLRTARRVTSKAAGYRISFTILVITLGIVALCAYWDGGAASPAALGFVTTTVFVANYTPHLRLMMGLEALTIGAYLTVAAAGRPTPPGHVFVHVAGMVMLVAVCSTQTRTLARQRSQLRALAALDPLTGALNRRGLAEYARHLFRHGCRPGPSLLCLDLDDFKLVNDRLGHAAGDELLRRTVSAAREALRAEDAIARIGGDEFVVVLVDADEATARAVADRIEVAVRRHAVVSIGTATAPHDGDTLDALMRTADRRLYRTKQQRHRSADPLLRAGHDLLSGGSETLHAP
ncbi:GGDEF domain-containing protein [Micromonospora coxensis]|uniref:Diguanylate cyclase (GGDEF) domain-containing protein n=1 Tax=Micromonospora coxensis TaxID=356852 RepID=A0A1C5GU47_9ACTN|nr:GGDEF domain-containing protein [Micromonospora coxensis]SCG37087.1 diguanylate cyclase (GGDEF) domain-containing protein [Micromonospora coxensis]